MGNGAALMLTEDQDFEIYKEITKIYEMDYLPKVKNGEMTEKDAYLAVKEIHQKLISAKTKLSGSESRADPWQRAPSGTKIFHVGDVVRVAEFDTQREGVVLEMIGHDRCLVDFGDSFDEFDVDDCTLLCKAEEYELNDRVEVKDGGLSFLGVVIKIHLDSTYDVQMLGDDPEDIERNVRPDKMRKVMTNRSVAMGRLRKASLAVIASTKLWKEIKFHDDHPLQEISEATEENSGQ